MDYLKPTDHLSKLGVSNSTLEYWRKEGKGPPWVKWEGSIRYPLKELEAWQAQKPGIGGGK